MKLWYFTANPPQQSRCGKIGSPPEVKNIDYEEKEHGRRNIQSDLHENQNKTMILLELKKHQHFL